MLTTCSVDQYKNSSTANFIRQEESSTAVCEISSVAYKLRGMKTPKSRRALTEEEKMEAERLHEIYRQRKSEAKQKGGNLTQGDVAERCEWEGQSAVSQYFNGRIPLNLDALLRLAAALDFKPSQVSPRLAKLIREESTPSNINISNVSNVSQPKTLHTYPVINWVRAGEWTEAVNPYDQGCEQHFESTDYEAKGAAFWLEVEGDSMTAPTGISIPRGMMILIDPEEQATNGSLVVAQLEDNNEATFKKLVIDGGQKYLKPLNPAYPVIPINGNCRIVGVAVEMKMSLKNRLH